ncbi:MAG: VOC family protein [Cyanobacteria bacterium J06648_11]
MKICTACLSLATPDLPRSRQFYRALLGVSPEIVQADKYAEFRLTGLRLSIYASTHPDFKASLGATGICLQVDDLDDVLQRPVVSELTISPVREASHGREVDFCDPDGNRIIIHEPSAAFREFLQLDART